MNAVTSTSDNLPKDSVRVIENIPVRNIWLLMLYASDLFRQLGSARISLEENPEKIADLVAEILCHHLEKRLKRNLSFGYQNKVEVLSRVRGRIDSLYTCLLYTSPSPRDQRGSRMPSSA